MQRISLFIVCKLERPFALTVALKHEHPRARAYISYMNGFELFFAPVKVSAVITFVLHLEFLTITHSCCLWETARRGQGFYVSGVL